MTEIEKERDELRHKLMMCEQSVLLLKKELKTAVNELCLRCGSYKVEHLGGECADCRFRKERNGDFSDFI